MEWPGYFALKTLVEYDGIEPLGATPLDNAYRVTAGNGEHTPKFTILKHITSPRDSNSFL